MHFLNKCVSLTLGPLGRNVVIIRDFGIPRIVNDGVTVARAIQLGRCFENIGCSLLRQAALKVNKVAGDGTTTVVVLAYELIERCLTQISCGSEPFSLADGIQICLDRMLEILPSYSKPVSKMSELSRIAFMASGDNEISSLIVEAIEKVGQEGILFVEEGNTVASEIEVVEGMKFSQGFISSYFITDRDRLEVVLEHAYVLITDKKITSFKKELLKLVELLGKKGKSLLIVSDGFGADALSSLIRNKLKGILNVVAVKAPGFAECRRTFLSDLAVLTGGNVISSAHGRMLEEVTIEDLGRARRVLVRKHYTTIIAESERREFVKKRCEYLKSGSMLADSLYERETFLERLANLSGGVALLRVGGFTEVELKDRSLRLEDAVNAVSGAIQEGIVPGGGITLLRLCSCITDLCSDDLFGDKETFDSTDGIYGGLLLLEALRSPFKVMIANGAREVPDPILGELVNHHCNYGGMGIARAQMGYDVARQKYVDVFAYGLVDPLKVIRSVLKNALSLACLVITTECTLVSI
jgi:chaperonin GroEL